MDISANDQALDALIPDDSAAVKPVDEIASQARTVAALDHLLINEQAAAEACRRAILMFHQLPVAGVLAGVMDGHQQRAIVLRETIITLHGVPTELRGQDHTTAELFSSDVHLVLALLLDLEQRGVADYRQALPQLDDLTRTLIEAELLPAQERALAALSGAQPPSPDGAV